MNIGRYEIVERIGVGGMGEVFRCRAQGVEGFQKDVVVKVVLPEMQGEPEFERAFVDEAKLSVQLQHPNIVQTLDLGKHEERLYLVMEYVDGHDVGFVLRTLRRSEGRVPIPIAVYIAIELLRGLDHAHKARSADGTPMEIIHRDVTPGNVMVGFNGSVKLADFGIARFTSRTQQKTTTGFVKGKIAFMPPEQVEARALAPATDVFSAALVLSTMLMGKHPLEHASEAELLDRVRTGDIPLPGSAVPDVPRTLDKIIAKALAPSLSDRTPSAQEMLEQLEAFVLDSHLRTGPGVLAAWLQETFRDSLARRAARGSGAHVAASPATSTGPAIDAALLASPAPLPVTPGPRPDVNIPATRQGPARPVSPKRRWMLLAPAAAILAGALGTGGFFARERLLLAGLRKDCEGEWRVLSQKSVAGAGAPGDPMAKGDDWRVLVRDSAEAGVRLSFRRGAEELLSVPLDLEREGATLVGRYNGVPVKFWPGNAALAAKAERMNLRVRLTPLGTVLNLDFAMFGEGLAPAEWEVVGERL